MATLAEARLKACRTWPFGSHAILSLVPIESQQVDVMGVDQHWRLYYRPSELVKLTADEAGGVILHEVSHLLLMHHQRATKIVPANAIRQDWVRWNTAADLAVNGNLAEEGVALPGWVEMPEKHGFERGMTAEAYYRLLEDKEQQEQQQKRQQQERGGQSDEQQDDDQDSIADAGDDDEQSDKQGQGNDDGQGDQDDGPANDGQGGGEPGAEDGDHGQDRAGDDGGDGEDTPGHGETGDTDGDPLPGGSCADGQQRPWEQGPPSEEEPGIKPHEADVIIRQVAEKIADKQCGNGKGGFRGWAQDVISPKVDPRTKLLRAVRKAVEFASGTGDYSYRRPNRRNPQPDMVLPSSVQPIPRVTVIVDTSGSMDKQDLGLSLGLVGKVLNGFRIRDGIKVICGDEDVQSVGKVFSPKNVELAGGGGTDMGVLIVAAAEQKPKPDLIVVCTDGYTPWPSAPVGVPVVACITREQSQTSVPVWIETVSLE